MSNKNNIMCKTNDFFKQNTYSFNGEKAFSSTTASLYDIHTYIYVCMSIALRQYSVAH